MKFRIFAVLGFSLVLVSGCATAMVTGAVVGTAATATKVAVKTTVGAGKLAYRGTKYAVKGTQKMISSDAPVEADGIAGDVSGFDEAVPE